MRPSYHFTPQANWLSDPNGLVYDGSLWHLFYQYNPLGETWGHMSWGHATSTDLAVWEEQPPALIADDRQMYFSGSAVIDTHDTAGFGANAMVAIYTRAARGDHPVQSQCLAFSHDKGIAWQEFAGNPVLDYGLADFRDPSVFWHDATRRWIMVVVLPEENAALILVSDNLRDWHKTGRIDGHSAAGRTWECPALMELPVLETGRTHWLFKVDALHDAPGSGALYQTGTFDGAQFVPDRDQWFTADEGRDFYAAIPWNGPADALGRPCWIGWMGNHAYQHDFPAREWRGVMSLPRRLALIQRGGQLLLSQETEPSVMSLFAAPQPVAAGHTEIPPACRIDVAPHYSGTLRIEGSPGQTFTIECAGEEILLERVDPGLPFLAWKRRLAGGPDRGMSIFLDSETCEILSGDGTFAAGFQHRLAGPGLALRASPPEQVSIAPLR